MKGSGGTEGGVGQFFIGLVLAGLAIYLFFDSVRVTTGVGLVSGGVHALMGRRRRRNERDDFDGNYLRTVRDRRHRLILRCQEEVGVVAALLGRRCHRGRNTQPHSLFYEYEANAFSGHARTVRRRSGLDSSLFAR